MPHIRTTPFIKRMRTNGGTLYSFNSSIEDIGLNINEKNNIVKISHFALLNIPSIEQTNNLSQNYFNVQAISGAWEYENDSLSIKDGRVLIAESFQNYASNLETTLLDQSSYNPELNETISERVFWKWLKETGAIRWVDSSSHWVEDIDSDYTSVVKYIGLVSTGNVRRDTFGTYNETYILLPTSHGQTPVYFKQTIDSNYNHGFAIGELGEKINGRDNWLQPHPDGLSYDAYYDFVDSSIAIGAYTLDVSSYNYIGPGWWYTAQSVEPTTGSNYYFTDTSTYIGDPSLYYSDLTYTGASGFSFRRSNVDCLGIEFDLNELKVIFNDTGLSYDKIATANSINNNFDFNAILIYYTVYNSTNEDELATNLLGVMFLDSPSGSSGAIGSGGILLPSIEKIQSQSSGFGTSYSLRLNIKSDNTIDDTNAIIVDYSTSDIAYAEDFNDTMAELKKTIQILNQQTATINYISTRYTNLTINQSSILSKLTSQQNDLNSIELTQLDTAALKAYHVIQDASILGNLSYNLEQDASIEANLSVYQLSSLIVGATELASSDISTNGLIIIPAPTIGKKLLLGAPAIISYTFDTSTYLPDDGGDDSFLVTYENDFSNGLSFTPALTATTSFSSVVPISVFPLDASGGIIVRTNGTYSGGLGVFKITVPYALVDISDI